MMFPTSSPTATILGSYRDAGTGLSVLRAVRRQGFYRSVALSYVAPGKTKVLDDSVFPAGGALVGAVIAAILVALYVALGFANGGTLAAFFLLVSMALLGALLGFVAWRLLDLVVNNRLIDAHRRWLLPQETLVIVRTPMDRARTVLTLMRNVERGQPATFVLRSPRSLPSRIGEALQGERFTLERLRLHAENVATRQRLAPRPGKTYPLWNRARESKRVVDAVNADLTDGASLGQSVSTAAEWLLDNGYIVQRHINDVLDNLSQGFYDVLPVLDEGSSVPTPRVHELARELVAHTDSDVNEQDVVSFLDAYQEVSPLTIAELWAMPLMLRLALVDNLSYLAVQVGSRQFEHERADFWANRLLMAARRSPDSLLALIVELAREQSDPPAYFAERLVSQLQGEPAALEPVRAWLENKWGVPVADVIQEEQNRHASIQVAIASTIGTLRRLSQMDWRETFERVSLAERILRGDPAGIYSRMDFDTRNRYRRSIELIARRSDATELDLARSAVAAAEAAEGRRAHVGYYLVDSGREEMEAEAHYRPTPGERVRRWIHRHVIPVYIGGIGALTVLVLGVSLWSAGDPGIGWPRSLGLALVVLLAIFPASEVGVQIVNYLTTLLLRPRVLPKLSFEDGIPDEWLTVVVVPILLNGEEGIQADVKRLEIRFLANQDPNLRFALLADFKDAPGPMTPEDETLLQAAIAGISDLNQRYQGNRFSLFYRTRVWSKSEQCWMGWERKRGKLEELNRWLIRNNDPEATAAIDEGTIHHIGDSAQLRGVRFVITLDSDTQLPHDVAHRLVGTLAHPLNRPVLSSDGRVQDGYTIIQPRVSTSLPSATATRFSRLFTDAAGIDPYTHAVSDVYQDLTGEASYHGKAIYDLAMFHQVLDQRFPDESLLSHDLIEGAHVRTGLASDVELLDEFPSSYVAYTSREHRWIRGDWQIGSWVLPSVPARGGGRVPNPLDPMNRWKILDNLRRSLVPIASVLLLISTWLVLSANIWVWAVLIALAMFFPAILGLPAWILSQSPRDLLKPGSWRDPARPWVRALFVTAFLPHQATLNLDAIVRVLYRRTVSRRRMLEWQTSQMAHDAVREQQHRLVWRVWLISLFAVAVLVLLAGANPVSLPDALPFLVLWLLFPALVGWLGGGRKPAMSETLSPADRYLLRRVARRTWRYFDEFVGRASNWLPPDNYQESLRVEVAQRTSPTNIGLWLVSSVTAHDFGYITLDQLIQRHTSTFETLRKLESYQGHLLNWYDNRTLEPLHPRYVSTVDSGNLLACLWTLVESYRDALARPILSQVAFHGLADTLALALLHERAVSDLPTGEDAGRTTFLISSLSALFAEPPDRLDVQVERIRAAAALASELAASLRTARLERSSMAEASDGNPASRDRTDAVEDAIYWIGQLEYQLARWVETIERYLPWVERLGTMPASYLTSLGAGATLWRDRALAEAPSLQTLGTGKHRPLVEFLVAATRVENPPEEMQTWLQDLKDAISYAQWLAGEMLAAAGGVVSHADELADGMDMKFLYDEERKLFSLGYNVSERRLDGTSYDLLASEARLASYVSIARSEVPVEHWFALGRPYGMPGGRRVLLSWSGTMFEYLMPLLFTRSYENSLLDSACRSAVAWQIEYARQQRIPWGMSEAAFAALDAHRIYQYQAFGVPGLGLKRGLEDDMVVAPYASALALMVEPRVAIENLKLLANLGALGRYGYYDSVDYTRRRRAERESGVIVYTYMVHHQGMIMLALHNVVNDWTIQKRFHADSRSRAAEPLLYERIPVAPPIITGPTRGESPPRLPQPSAVEVTRGFTTPDSPVPRTQLLGTDAYSVMVTNAGGGYSRWRDFDISRWRADTTLDSWGCFVYVRDTDRSLTWSAAHQPVKQATSRYLVNFSSNRAQFERRDDDIATIMDVVVCLEDEAEVRRITLVNYSNTVRHLEVTSYAELVLAPANADRAHPAFSKMFVQTEAVENQGTLLAWRNRRSPEDPEIWAMHVLASLPSDGAEAPVMEYETDRARFIGRGRTLSSPAALDGPLSRSAGSVLDPIFSIRHRVAIEPGGRVQLAFVTGAGASRASVLAMAEKFRDLRSIRRVFEMAESQATLVARHLRVSPEDLQRYQQLASHMLYPNPRFRAPAAVLRRNRRGQSGLWAYGVSGDLPILLVTIGDQRDMPLVREALLAHTYWRLRGLKTDLVILDEEAAGYEQPLRDNLRRLVQSLTQYTGTEQPGGVFLRAAKQIPPDDLDLLMTAARVVLVAARGDLARQLTAAPEVPRASASPLTRRQFEEEPSSPLPFMELPYFNGFGGFTPDGREYATYLGPGTDTPAPWVNVMANRTFGAMVSESGAGFAWFGNSQSNRLLPWSNDPVTDPSGDAIYIQDEQLGISWTPTPSPIRELDAYRARHGQGYTVFEHNSHAIEQELITFVPMDRDGGLPVRVQRLRLRNRSSHRRLLRLIYFAEWVLGQSRDDTQMHVVTGWVEEHGMLLARNFYHPDYSGRIAFVASSLKPTSFTADRTEFLGRNGGTARPAALGRGSLSRRFGAGFDPCAAIEVRVEIDPGREAEVTFVLGEAADVASAGDLARRFREPDRVEEALHNTGGWWDQFLGTIQVETPVLSANFLLNRWLLYQALSCRVWGRSAFYQSGGAIGFRDQLQDSLALIYSAPDISRAQILTAAARQFTTGDVQHWWHPESGAGVRTRISDDLLWLPYVVAQYVRVTGDDSILDEKTPFLVGPELKPEEHEAYFAPTVSEEKGSVLDHCRRAIARGLTHGPHGLPLIGTGDWNDGMNRVGAEGKGESVWLAWFLLEVLDDFAWLLDMRAEAAEADMWRAKARKLKDSVENEAWDGDWYLRAYFDDGSPLGSSTNMEAQIDSIAQSWGVISGRADPERAEHALAAAWEQLVRKEDGLALLFTPPFSPIEIRSALGLPDPGYIAGYPAGVRENGGQYTHAALWLAMAFARSGDGDRAVELLRILNPVEHARTPEEVARYRTEPYVVAADVYALEGRVGQGGWSWYTGSAGWMYRVWIEEVLGFKLRGTQLRLEPRIPRDWEGFRLRFRFGGARYLIEVENGEAAGREVASIEVDGKLLSGDAIDLRDDGAEHNVIVRLAAAMPEHTAVADAGRG